MVRTLKSYVCGQWHTGEGDGSPLLNPTTEEVLAQSNTSGIDFKAALEYARSKGGNALRELTFAQRGALLTKMSQALHARRDELITLATANGGNTRSDAKFDIDGATFTLSQYGKTGTKLGEEHLIADGAFERLARSPRYVGAHVYAPMVGAAIHINAFNFPAWGFCEKAALALLAGMPVITKPATSTAIVTERMIEILVEDDVLPEGALSFIAGSTGDLLEHVNFQDAIAFTGSADTGNYLRSKANIVNGSIRFNVEADSLNSAVLGPDVEVDSDTFDLFAREVVVDMTQKTGQKCTAIRRVLVPTDRLEDVRNELCERLAEITVGNPAVRGVNMGPLATKAQLEDVKAGIETLGKCGDRVFGDGGRGDLVEVEEGKGFFLSPVLLQASNSKAAAPVHNHEVFGPCATLLPYSGDSTEAVDIVRLGNGGLVSSVYTDDRKFASEMVRGIAPFHGRITLGSARVADHSPGPGTVMPALVHGGPGRAGGGEELGGIRGMTFYMQRTAVQGSSVLLDKILPPRPE